MNRNTAFGIIRVICAAALIAGLALSIRTVFGFSGHTFPGMDGYQTGDAEIKDPVNSLDIDWTSGKINIEYHNEDTVVISEKSAKEIKEDKKMCWIVDGETLKIRFRKPGLSLLGGFVLEKELTVILPEDTILKNADISATSGKINIPALKAERVDLDVTSGDISADVSARTISASLTSGSTELKSEGDAEEIKMDSTSGDLSVDAAEAGRIRVNSTSGDIRVRSKTFDDIDIDATSGDIRAELSADPGFTATFSTTSGEIEHDIPLTQQGKSYVCGDGSGKVKISTTSGDILLTEAS